MRKKSRITSEYYSGEKLRSVPASYYVNVGLRSNGKTYDAKAFICEKVHEGKTFAYIRRTHNQVVRSEMDRLFTDTNQECFDKYGFAIAYSPSLKGFFKVDEYGEIIDEGNGIIGKRFCLEDMMKDKGNTFYPDVIFFDEFVDETYFRNEIKRFLNVLSTLIRNKKSGVTILMSGNTISKNCPYFKLLGIPIDKVKIGDLITIRHNSGAIVRFEYCKTYVPKEVIDADGSDYYFGFDDTIETVMITKGEWETMEINCEGVDGYTWASKRMLIPIYFSNRRLYEISIANTSTPVAYVREVNNQNGIVRKEIRYIFSYDGRKFKHSDDTWATTLTPFSYKVPLLDERTTILYNKFLECVVCGRIISTDALTGTEFINTLKQASIIK